MTRRRLPIWQPSEDQMRHWPPVSGNAINGLGEASQRLPLPSTGTQQTPFRMARFSFGFTRGLERWRLWLTLDAIGSELSTSL
jgi:hypothetical protein